MTAAARTWSDVPVFPLPNFVLFPGTATGLHIFEPRYRAMTAAALAGDRQLVLVGLRPGFETDYAGSPPAYDVGTIVDLTDVEALPDGRYEMVARSMARVQVAQVHQLVPYRIANIEAWSDEAESPSTIASATDRLDASLRALMLAAGQRAAGLGAALASTSDPSERTFVLAAMLLKDPEVRQAVLESRSVVDRAERLTDRVATLLLRLQTPETLN